MTGGVGPNEYIERRSKRYMAQVLDLFEEHIEPAALEAGLTGEVQSFKGEVRAKFKALGIDAKEVMELAGINLNGLALEIRDDAQPAR